MNRSVDAYMMGGCHLFAVALHRLSGMDLAVVAGPTRDGLSVFHVVCLDADGRAWDVRGDHSPDDLTGEQEAMDGSLTWLVRLGGEADVFRLALGDDPKLNPISEGSVNATLDDVVEVLGGQVELDPGSRSAMADFPATHAIASLPEPRLDEGARWVPPATRRGPA